MNGKGRANTVSGLREAIGSHGRGLGKAFRPGARQWSPLQAFAIIMAPVGPLAGAVASKRNLTIYLTLCLDNWR